MAVPRACQLAASYRDRGVCSPGAQPPSHGRVGGVTSQQAALAAQGAALAHQQAGVMMQAAYPASAVQQFQVNGQPTTIAL